MNGHEAVTELATWGVALQLTSYACAGLGASIFTVATWQ